MRMFLLFIWLSHFKHCLVENTKWFHSLSYHATYSLALQLLFTHLGTTFPSLLWVYWYPVEMDELNHIECVSFPFFFHLSFLCNLHWCQSILRAMLEFLIPYPFCFQFCTVDLCHFLIRGYLSLFYFCFIFSLAEHWLQSPLTPVAWRAVAS